MSHKTPVIGKTDEGKIVVAFDSFMDARKKGWVWTMIHKCCNNQRKHYHKLCWEYSNYYMSEYPSPTIEEYDKEHVCVQ